VGVLALVMVTAAAASTGTATSSIGGTDSSDKLDFYRAIGTPARSFLASLDINDNHRSKQHHAA
jgi:hypothetical protein